MNRIPAIKISLAAAGWLWMAGCATPGPSVQNYSVRHIEGLGSVAVFGVAEAALMDLGYGIEKRNEAAGVLTALPLEGMPPGPSGSRGTLISAERPRRSVVHIRIEPGAETVKVHCKVIVQQQDTETHRMFVRDAAGLDSPSSTPIDRDAATTTKQNTVWRTTGRDKAAERKILSRIVELTGAGDSSP